MLLRPWPHQRCTTPIDWSFVSGVLAGFLISNWLAGRIASQCQDRRDIILRRRSKPAPRRPRPGSTHEARSNKTGWKWPCGEGFHGIAHERAHTNARGGRSGPVSFSAACIWRMQFTTCSVHYRIQNTDCCCCCSSSSPCVACSLCPVTLFMCDALSWAGFLSGLSSVDVGSSTQRRRQGRVLHSQSPCRRIFSCCSPWAPPHELVNKHLGPHWERRHLPTSMGCP